EALPARRVTPDATQGMRERPLDALGLLRLVELEPLVHRADHHVELLQDLVGQIERTVLEDVHLAAAQDADPAHACLDLRDLVPLPADLIGTEATRVVRRLRLRGP